MTRPYRLAHAVPEGAQGVVLLDGRPLLTPALRPMRTPTLALAEAVAAEWAAQGEVVRPASMPVTRIAGTALDLMPARRADALAEVTGHAETDLLCFRVAAPADLASRQDLLWQPWLDWAARHHDATLTVARGALSLLQPPAGLTALGAVVRRQGDWQLTGLHAAVGATGSLVLGLAMLAGVLAPDRAFEAALLDELYTAERWGLEEEQAGRHAALRRDLDGVDRFFRALERP